MMRQETEQRLRLTLAFFPFGIRFVDLVRRSGLSRRSVWRALNGYGEQRGLIDRGLVGVSTGGYSVLPSSMAEVRRHAVRKALDRRRLAGRLPNSVLRKLTGAYLPKTPFYRLLPQTLGRGRVVRAAIPRDTVALAPDRTAEESQRFARQLARGINYLARSQEYLSWTTDVWRTPKRPIKSRNSRSDKRDQSR